MQRWRILIFFVLTSAWGIAQQNEPAKPAELSAQAGPSTLSQEQIRNLIRLSADNDLENDKKQRDYTYVERQQERRLNGNRQVKSTETKTYDVLEIYGEQVQKLIAKDDKPLSAKAAQKEDERIQKLIDKRKNESESDRKKRLEKKERPGRRAAVCAGSGRCFQLQVRRYREARGPRQLRH